ncbi:flagellar motor protein MotB [bacterium DOLJORAL78_65_58]|nr:MAG: flagellar motor protein MotB [bacterium DOLZORAL124_64_63]PIE76085.1 MAG: flagellar motor protein MotB [bacterium DOLJORAL78_65_58]
MGKKCKNIIIKQGLDDWVMTYGDMMSLLLTFFVLIVSFSSMQETKFEQAAASLSEAFGVMADPESVIEFNEPIMPNHNPQRDAEVLYEVRSVEKMLLENDWEDQVEIEVTEDGVLFRINAPFLFTSGGAELRNEPRSVLEQLAGFFQKAPYKVKIHGHTDSIPINSARYPSNWELSAARAVTVARYFQSLGVPPERLEATGYGEHRPIATNETPEGRAKNRRVEIFLQLEKNKLPAAGAVPFEKVGEVGDRPAPEEVENGPVRPIINPVTGRLGQLPGTQQR